MMHRLTLTPSLTHTVFQSQTKCFFPWTLSLTRFFLYRTLTFSMETNSPFTHSISLCLSVSLSLSLSLCLSLSLSLSLSISYFLILSLSISYFLSLSLSVSLSLSLSLDILLNFSASFLLGSHYQIKIRLLHLKSFISTYLPPHRVRYYKHYFFANQWSDYLRLEYDP